jgi:hypothetical protein
MLDEAKRNGLVALDDAQVPTWASPDVQERASTDRGTRRLTRRRAHRPVRSAARQHGQSVVGGHGQFGPQSQSQELMFFTST